MKIRDWMCLAFGHRWAYVGKVAGRDKWMCRRCGAVSVDYLPRTRDRAPELHRG